MIRLQRLYQLMCLALLLCAVGISRVEAGLRDIWPRPQQMGFLSEEPVCYMGTPYLIVPALPTAEEQVVTAEALQRITDRIGNTPQLLYVSEYTGQSPAIWMGTLARWPALDSALDSAGIAGLGATTNSEEYQIVVEEARILLGAADLRGLRWGVMALVELMADVSGRLYVDHVYIRDWPDFRKRIATVNTPMRTTGQVEYAHFMTDLSYGLRFNEIEWNDGITGSETRLPSEISQSLVLAEKIRSNGMTLVMSADRTAWGVSNNSWQEGVPIRDMVMQVTSSGFVPVPGGYSVTVTNSGFESWTGSRPTGWTMKSDSYFSHVSRDASVKHSGSSSVRFSGFSPSSPGDPDLRQSVRLGSYRMLKVKFWYKTSNYSGKLRLLALGPAPVWGGIDKSYAFDVADNADWTLFERTICSFYADTVLILAGPCLPTGGTVWLDDISVETGSLHRMVRRDDTPLQVYRHSTLMSEGADYRVVETSSPAISNYVAAPRLERISGGRLAVGDTVKVNWSCAFLYQAERETECFSLLEPLVAYQTGIRVLDSLFHPDGFKIHINEVSYANYDDRCRRRQMTPAQLVGSYCRQMYQIIQGRRPNAPVRIYGDAFDIFVNDPRAMPITTGPWTVGALQELPAAVEMMAMQHYTTNLDSTFAYFSRNGRSSVMAEGLWLSIENFISGAATARKYPLCNGIQFYVWDGDCSRDDMRWRAGVVGALGWNMGPYIIHAPERPITRPDSVTVVAEIWTDTLHSASVPSITSASLKYRLLPSTTWITVPLTRSGTERYATTIRSIPPAATSLEYYLSATDHRAQTATTPVDAPQRTFLVPLPTGGAPAGGSGGDDLPFTWGTGFGSPFIEWIPVEDALWYDVHCGMPLDLAEPSSTLVSRQSVQCPQFLFSAARFPVLDPTAVHVIAARKQKLAPRTEMTNRRE